MSLPPNVAELSNKVMQAQAKVSGCRTSVGRKKAKEELDAIQAEYRRAFRQAKREGLVN